MNILTQIQACLQSFNLSESVIQTNGKYTRIANPSILVRDAQRLTSRTAQNMNLLNEETMIDDEVAWMTQWNLTKSLNDAINDGEVMLANAKYMNDIYLRVLKTDMDDITENEINDVIVLANSCPYLAGDAVYQARVLATAFGSLNGYDDLVICNSQGVYKGGQSKLQTELNALEIAMNKKQLSSLIKVYPNPAISVLNIDYQELVTGVDKVLIFDITGKELQTIDLSDIKNKVAIDLKGYANGIYTYKLKANNGESYTGKFIIE